MGEGFQRGGLAHYWLKWDRSGCASPWEVFSGFLEGFQRKLFRFSYDLNVLYLCLQLLSCLYLYFTNTLYLYFSKTLYLQMWAALPLLVMLSLFSQTHSGPGRGPCGIFSYEDYDCYDNDQNFDGEIIF